MSALQKVRSAPLPQKAFGLHQINGIWYLFQDTMPDGFPITSMENQHKYLSDRNTDEAEIGGACTHNINPFLVHRRIPKCQWSQMVSLAEDPLVELFMPVPMSAKQFKSNILVLDVGFNPSWFFLIKNLERLSSPLHSKVDPWLTQYQNKRLSDLELSNLQPLVYTLTESPLSGQTQSEVVRLAVASKNSTVNRPVLLLVKSKEYQPLLDLLGDLAEPLHSKLTERSLVTNIMHLPFEHMGSRIMGHFGMNGELSVA